MKVGTPGEVLECMHMLPGGSVGGTTMARADLVVSPLLPCSPHPVLVLLTLPQPPP
jgi:hypothetical protein